MATNEELQDGIRKAIGAHGAWKLRLKTALSSGGNGLDPATICRNDCCEFGKWLLSSSMSPEIRAGMPYKVIYRLHTEFHQCAGSVAGAILAGKTAEAGNMLDGEFTERSEKLKRALNKWRGELS